MKISITFDDKVEEQHKKNIFNQISSLSSLKNVTISQCEPEKQEITHITREKQQSDLKLKREKTEPYLRRCQKFQKKQDREDWNSLILKEIWKMQGIMEIKFKSFERIAEGLLQRIEKVSGRVDSLEQSDKEMEGKSKQIDNSLEDIIRRYEKIKDQSALYSIPE